MTTYWLISRKEYIEVNESMVCEWPAKRKKKKKKASIDSTISSTETTLANGGSSVGLNSPFQPSVTSEKETTELINSVATKLTAESGNTLPNSSKTELESVSENPETGEQYKDAVNTQINSERKPRRELPLLVDERANARGVLRSDLQIGHPLHVEVVRKESDSILIDPPHQSAVGQQDSTQMSAHLTSPSHTLFLPPQNLDKNSSSSDKHSDIRAVSTSALHDVVPLGISEKSDQKSKNLSNTQRYPSVPNLNDMLNHPCAPVYEHGKLYLDCNKKTNGNLEAQKSSVAKISSSVVINLPFDPSSNLRNLSQNGDFGSSTHLGFDNSNKYNTTQHMPVREYE